jgi:hypothetical protein
MARAHPLWLSLRALFILLDQVWTRVSIVLCVRVCVGWRVLQLVCGGGGVDAPTEKCEGASEDNVN